MHAECAEYILSPRKGRCSQLQLAVDLLNMLTIELTPFAVLLCLCVHVCLMLLGCHVHHQVAHQVDLLDVRIKREQQATARTLQSVLDNTLQPASPHATVVATAWPSPRDMHETAAKASPASPHKQLGAALCGFMPFS